MSSHAYHGICSHVLVCGDIMWWYSCWYVVLCCAVLCCAMTRYAVLYHVTCNVSHHIMACHVEVLSTLREEQTRRRVHARAHVWVYRYIAWSTHQSYMKHRLCYMVQVRLCSRTCATSRMWHHVIYVTPCDMYLRVYATHALVRDLHARCAVP